MFQSHQMSLLTAGTCPQDPHCTCEPMQSCSLGNLTNFACTTAIESAPNHTLHTEKARYMHCGARYITVHHKQPVALHYLVNILPCWYAGSDTCAGAKTLYDTGCLQCFLHACAAHAVSTCPVSQLVPCCMYCIAAIQVHSCIDKLKNRGRQGESQSWHAGSPYHYTGILMMAQE